MRSEHPIDNCTKAGKEMDEIGLFKSNWTEC